MGALVGPCTIIRGIVEHDLGGGARHDRYLWNNCNFGHGCILAGVNNCHPVRHGGALFLIALINDERRMI